MKKPKLSIISAQAPVANDPPRPLSAHGSELWRSIMSEYDIADVGGREMLAQACTALDRAEDCADHIRRDGAVVHTRSGPKDHPALKHELANRAFVVRTLQRLGLDVEPIRPVGRPAGGR